MKSIAIVSLALAAATPALAHSGHDPALSGATHWLVSPLHGLGVLALAGLVAVWRWRVRDE